MNREVYSLDNGMDVFYSVEDVVNSVDCKLDRQCKRVDSGGGVLKYCCGCMELTVGIVEYIMRKLNI